MIIRYDAARVTSVVMALGCTFANLTFFYLFGFPVNGAFIAMAVVLGFLIARPVLRFNERHLWLYLGLIVACALKIPGSEHLDESLASIAQIALVGAFLVVALGQKVFLAEDEFASLLGYLMAAHAVLLIAQFVMLNSLDSYSLQNPYGSLSPDGPLGERGFEREPYLPHWRAELKRPNGLFSEPSVAAAMSAFAAAVVLSGRSVKGTKKLVLCALLFIGTFVTFAFTGWLMIVALGAAMVLFSRRLSFGLKLASLVLTVAFVGALPALGGEYLLNRIEATQASGGSTYVRLIGPTLLTLDVLQQNPFGLPLNDPTFIASRDYMVDYAGRTFTTIDNFYLWVAVYFGVPGLFACLWFLWKVWGSLRRRRERALPLMVMAIFAGATGAAYNALFILPLAAAIAMVQDPAQRPDRGRRRPRDVGKTLNPRNFLRM